MAEHFKITLRVAYEEGSCPSDMATQLRRHFNKIESFLYDDDDNVVVENWSADVKEEGHKPSPVEHDISIYLDR